MPTVKEGRGERGNGHRHCSVPRKVVVLPLFRDASLSLCVSGKCVTERSGDLGREKDDTKTASDV